ncbi:iron-sulfur cluster assembly scaffold protein [Candidatus Phytoplasma pini]|nr:iron-sulfur cluster assembly scaffold protein [Candidatus Phytoplasma pini]TVY12120.1 nifU-like protein [Candidatus Phytoplasma pini]
MVYYFFNMKKNELYHSLIMKHYRNPLNKGLRKNDNEKCFIKENEIINCGDDRITLQVCIDNDLIFDIKYEVEGCAILISSISLMSLYVKKIPFIKLQNKIINFVNMLQGTKFKKELLEEELQIFEVIKNFPSKFACASLPWQLLLQIIQQAISNKKN